MQAFLKTYFDFHYGIGLVIGAVVFCSCMFMTRRREMKRGGEVSGKEVFWSLALSIYVMFLLGATLLNRTLGDGEGLRLELFWSYRVVFQEQNWELAKQILYNILAFIPWGILVPKCFGRSMGYWKVVGSAITMSVGIELVQLIGQCGLCELDDVVHNTLGAVIGYGIYMRKEIR